MKYFFIFLICFWYSNVNSQITIILDKVPSDTPSNSDIFIAGNFNQWNPGSNQYKLSKDLDGIHSITFSPAIGKLEFKFTRGSWNTVEGNAQGTYIPNRTYQYNGQADTITLQILGWEGMTPTPSTASPQVSILNDSFYITSLNRYRKIWLYLPKDYNSSLKTYPVIYMHDGQNLFDQKTSFAGEWKIDETLDSLYDTGHPSCIVVGIDNGGGNRLNEYSPWVNPQYGGGEGDKYLDFIVNELKPYIDQNFRTKTDAKSTAMIGSSMGGLISLYAGTKYPEIFGKIGPLSSAFWFSPNSYTYSSSKEYKDWDQKIYMIAGGQEGGNQVGDMYKMRDILLSKQYNNNLLKAVDHPNQGHNESYWAKEFPTIYQWLFDNTVSVKESPINYSVKQINDSLCISGDLDNFNTLSIYDLNGLKIAERSIYSVETCVELPSKLGIYIITITDSQGIQFSDKYLIGR